MKANRKFLRGDDDAVSPVIAVILMVAITVVLAATVYVWVSGFGSQSGNPAKTISLTSSSSLSNSNSDSWKNYTVAAATSGMKYSDITLTLDGVTLPCASPAVDLTDSWLYSQGGTPGCTLATVIGAGDRIQIFDDGGGMSGKTLRVLDAQANSVILTLTIG